jgi:hypothetical protein
MSPLAIGAVVFVCAFGGASLGMFLGAVLPKHQVSAESKEGVRVAIAMIATLTALVIGLLTASAKGSFDTKNNEFKGMISRLVLLDRTMAHYGPETKEARNLLRQRVAARLSDVWGNATAEQIQTEAIGKGPGLEEIQDKLWALSPQNDAQRWLRSKAVEIGGDIDEASTKLLQQIDSAVQWPFLVILIFWLTVIFTSFGLFSPANATMRISLLVCAISAAGAIYLILQMDQPYSGLIKISAAPLRTALDQLGQP